MIKKLLFSIFTKILVTALFFTIVSLVAAAQINSTSNKSYVVNINSTDCLQKANVLSAKQTFLPIADREYSWYAFNKIMKTKGGYDGRILHGEYKSFYPNNNLKEKGYYKKGLKNKVWESWNESGQLKEIVYWKNGLKNGKYILYSETGKVILEANYSDNLLNGKMNSYDDAGVALEKRKFKYGVEINKEPKMHLKRKSIWQSVKGIFKKKKTKSYITPDKQSSGTHS